MWTQNPPSMIFYQGAQERAGVHSPSPPRRHRVASLLPMAKVSRLQTGVTTVLDLTLADLSKSTTPYLADQLKDAKTPSAHS